MKQKFHINFRFGLWFSFEVLPYTGFTAALLWRRAIIRCSLRPQWKTYFRRKKNKQQKNQTKTKQKTRITLKCFGFFKLHVVNFILKAGNVINAFIVKPDTGEPQSECTKIKSTARISNNFPLMVESKQRAQSRYRKFLLIFPLCNQVQVIVFNIFKKVRVSPG